MRDTLTRPSVTVGALVLVLLTGVGIWLINLYAASERQRDLLDWESRLGLVADARSEAVETLLAGHAAALDELAANASLQLYLWQYGEARRAGEATPDTAALGYLRNLLLATAARNGYALADGPLIGADLPQPRRSGLMLYDADAHVAVTTPGMGDAARAFDAVAREVLAAPGTRVTRIAVDAQGRALVLLAVTVPAVIGTAASGAAPAGVLIGVRSADQDLFPLLARGPTFAEDNETLLLAREGEVVVHLSPGRDGSGPLRRTLPLSRTALAEVAAVTDTGAFVVADNHRGRRVLQLSRPIRGQDWVLALQVDAGQALGAGSQRRQLLIAALSFALLAVIALALAAWRHGSSVRAAQHATELSHRAAVLQRQTDLLHAIADHIDVLTLLVNREQHVVFANQATANAVGVRRAEIPGSPLSALFATPARHVLQTGIATCQDTGVVHRQLVDFEIGDKLHGFQLSCIPLARIGEEVQPTLLVMSDVTGLQDIQRRHDELLRTLIGTLAHAVDLHDPYNADQARRMAEVADAVARELGLDDRDRESLDLAAMLANIGKIMIPSDVLTKRGPLTDEERRLLHQHVEFALEMLKDIDFEGPVLSIIAEKQELLDGSGYPKGLRGDEISLAGRILSVANAFVALVGIRAYREGVSIPDALDELLRQAGTRYDRRVIAALFHVVENRRDWQRWQQP